MSPKSSTERSRAFRERNLGQGCLACAARKAEGLRPVKCDKCRAAYETWKNKDRPAYLRSQRDRSLQRKFGITLDQYEAVHAAQGGVCAICARPETIVLPSGNFKPLSVDHDHKTKIVRKLLCTSCNALLGHAKEDKAILQAAVAYLEEHNSPEREVA